MRSTKSPNQSPSHSPSQSPSHSPTPHRLLLLSASAAAASAALVVAFSAPAGAVETRTFTLDDAASLAAGELERTAVLDNGSVVTGAELRRIAMPEGVPLVYSAARGVGDALFLGTGNDGRIYRLAGDQLTPFAETGQLLVAALAMGTDDVLYAGTLPEGRIYAIPTTGAVAGQVHEITRIDQVEHVWDLVWDARRNVLFAATGPEGRVYAIDPRSNQPPALWWDSEASHVMSLALDNDGSLYAGTSDAALVVRLRGPGRAEVVYDFPGNEITALAVRDGQLAVAANEFPSPPAITSSSNSRSSTATRTPRPRPGKGRIYRIHRDGRAEREHAQEDGHFADVELAADGTIYAGAGSEGRIVRVGPDRSVTTWIDVDERQVLALSLSGSSPFFVTGDGAAIYRVLPGRPRDAIWNSKVLDGQFLSRFGQLTWRGTGQLEFQTRSGNVEAPDGTWSDWSAALSQPGPIRSPAARFLQIRARFQRDPSAVLFAVEAYYLPQNQRAIPSQIHIKAQKNSTNKNKNGRRAQPEPSSTYTLAWSVDNPDQDELRYRLRYREEGQTVWRAVQREDALLTETEYEWDTSAVPDGRYLVEVEASDELDNPEALTLRERVTSEPILIDNHAPRITELALRQGRIQGRAEDSLGPIARLEYAVDGGEWRVLFPTDDLLDTADERFELTLTALALPAGDHILAVRATDAGHNLGSREISFTTR